VVQHERGFVGWKSASVIRYDRGMTAVTQTRMNVDEFLAWAEKQPGRFELYNGGVYAVSPEGAGHAKVKLRMHIALVGAVRRTGVPCHVLPDGMTVRVDEHTAHEPDAQVYCGQELPAAAIEVPNPVILIEVLSPSTRQIDASVKLAGCFRLPSVIHYLIVDPTGRSSCTTAVRPTAPSSRGSSRTARSSLIHPA
jgi:Uma2 family endonuclease